MLYMHKSEKVQEKHKTIQQKRAKDRPLKTNKGLEEERVKRGAKEQRAKKGQKGQRATDRARP